MRILLDENLPMRLIAALRALGHDAEHAYTRHLGSRPDPDVRLLAKAEDRFLITQDKRFADTRVFIRGTHPGVLSVRIKHPGRTKLFNVVRELFEREDVESWKGCFVVLKNRKLRVNCPEVEESP